MPRIVTIDGFSNDMNADGCFSDIPSVSRDTDSGGRQNARRQHTSLGPNQAETPRFPRNDRPYGLNRKESQTEKALIGDCQKRVGAGGGEGGRHHASGNAKCHAFPLGCMEGPLPRIREWLAIG